MSLWGKYDLKPQTNTATATVTVTAANATAVGVNTKFSTDFEAGDFLYVGANHYRFDSIANATVATVSSADNGVALVGAQSNGDYIVSEKPIYVTGDSSVSTANVIYGVSEAEMGANTGVGEADYVTHAGWVKRTAGTGGRAGRIHYETLVAMSSISGDADDDTKLSE